MLSLLNGRVCEEKKERSRLPLFNAFNERKLFQFGRDSELLPSKRKEEKKRSGKFRTCLSASLFLSLSSVECQISNPKSIRFGNSLNLSTVITVTASFNAIFLVVMAIQIEKMKHYLFTKNIA